MPGGNQGPATWSRDSRALEPRDPPPCVTWRDPFKIPKILSKSPRECLELELESDHFLQLAHLLRINSYSGCIFEFDFGYLLKLTWLADFWSGQPRPRPNSDFYRILTAQSLILTTLLPHICKFWPHFCRTFPNFYRTFTAHFGIIGKCDIALFGKKNRTKSPPLS